MNDHIEKKVIVSGLGLSQMGRKTGRRAFDLTMESSLAAIADAGLERTDIDGLASVGETAISELQDVFRLDLNWFQSGMQFGGPITPTLAACVAIAAGLCKHVLIYRT